MKNLQLLSNFYLFICLLFFTTFADALKHHFPPFLYVINSCIYYDILRNKFTYSYLFIIILFVYYSLTRNWPQPQTQLPSCRHAPESADRPVAVKPANMHVKSVKP